VQKKESEKRRRGRGVWTKSSPVCTRAVKNKKGVGKTEEETVSRAPKPPLREKGGETEHTGIRGNGEISREGKRKNAAF